MSWGGKGIDKQITASLRQRYATSHCCQLGTQHFADQIWFFISHVYSVFHLKLPQGVLYRKNHCNNVWHVFIRMPHQQNHGRQELSAPGIRKNPKLGPPLVSFPPQRLLELQEEFWFPLGFSGKLYEPSFQMQMTRSKKEDLQVWEAGRRNGNVGRRSEIWRVMSEICEGKLKRLHNTSAAS